VEVGEEVAGGFLAVVEDVAEGRPVDGRGDIATELLEAVVEGGDESFGRDRGSGSIPDSKEGYVWGRQKIRTSGAAARYGNPIPLPENLPHPAD
jgi:hypothetical protein